MAIDHFIPKLWAARVLEHLDKALVYGALTTKEYQDEANGILNWGDTVNINSFADPTIGDYTKNGTIGAPEVLTSDQRQLVINQAKYFNFGIDDIDAAQQKPKLMDSAMARAAYGLADQYDRYIASLYVDVAASNIVGLGNDTTPVVPTKTNVYEYFTQASMLLDEASVPSSKRWAVIPPWLKKTLLNSGEFAADTALGDTVKTTGQLGSIAGFTVYVSNNVPNTSGARYKIMFGYPRAIASADQLNSIEAYRPERSFSDAVKGLHVYGGKLIQPTGIAVMTANKA